MYRVAVTDDRLSEYDIETEVLKKIGATIDVYNFMPESDCGNSLTDYDAIIVNLYSVGRKVIEKLKNCRIIQRYGVGYDNVDVEAATEHSIWVGNVPDYSREEVSDHALGLLFDCVRNISFADRGIRRGEWNLAGQQKNYRIQGKVLGIVGYGAIARRLHEKTKGFGLSRVLVHDPFVNADIIVRLGAEPVEFQQLLEDSDYITLHLPLTVDTLGMFGPNEFKKMKSTAILINTCRGGVVNQSALATALESGSIGGAGLDVYETEPLPSDSLFRELGNVVLTDHTSWYSEESIIELRRKVAENVVQALTNQVPTYVVNNILEKTKS